MENLIPKQTIGGVIAEKIAGHIRAHKFTELLKQAMELMGGLFLGAAIVVPGQIVSGFTWMLTTHDYVIPKVVTVMMLFFYRKKFWKIIGRIQRTIAKRTSLANKEKLLDGIPVSELTDYLIRNKHFKREGVNGVRETFGLNMERFNKLASRLEANGVLVRGVNNSRQLDGKWSRQQLIDYLSGTEKSEDMQPHFKIHRLGASAKIRLDNQEIAACQ